MQNLMGFGGTILQADFLGAQIFKLLSPYLKAHLKVHPTTCVAGSLNLVLETKKREKERKNEGPLDWAVETGVWSVTASLPGGLGAGGKKWMRET